MLDNEYNGYYNSSTFHRSNEASGHTNAKPIKITAYVLEARKSSNKVS